MTLTPLVERFTLKSTVCSAVMLMASPAMTSVSDNMQIRSPVSSSFYALVQWDGTFKGTISRNDLLARDPELFQGANKAVFQRLASVWRQERGPTSSVTRMAAHPAYKAIIKLGEPVVPFILAELKARPDHWFIALMKITGENPVRDSHRGNIHDMTDDWIKWGILRGIIQA